MMKVNLRNNRIMVTITIINLIVLIFAFFTKAGGEGDLMGLFIALLIFSVYYVLLLAYLAKILAVFNEQPVIVGAFSVVACLEVINLAKGLFRLDSIYSTSIGVLMEVLSVYMAIQAFRVKNKVISLPFRLFGIAVLFLSFANFILLLSLPSITGKQVMYYWQFTATLILCSGYYILKRVSEYLKTSSDQTVEIIPD